MRISNAPWSPEEDRELEAAVKANVSVQRLAVRFGRPSTSIRRTWYGAASGQAALKFAPYLARLNAFGKWSGPVNNIIYIVGLIVVVLAVLAFFGLR